MRPRRLLAAGTFLTLPSPALAHGAGETPGSFDLLVAGIIAAALLAYGAGVWRAARKGRRVVRWPNVLSFVAGCSIFFAVLASPLHGEADLYLAAHMIQHIVLVTIAPILVVVGRPDLLILAVLSRRARSYPARIGRLALRSPLLAAAVQGVAFWAWHAPPAFDAALQNDTVHFLEHLSFVATALWFWAAVMAASRRASGRIEAILAILATLIHGGVLGALLAFSTRLIYPAYRDEAALLGFVPLADQQLAGLIMWVPGGLTYLAVGIWIAYGLLGRDAPPYSAASSRSV